MIGRDFYFLKPKSGDDYQRLSVTQRALLERTEYDSIAEAAKARLKLQLSLKIELEIAKATSVFAV